MDIFDYFDNGKINSKSMFCLGGAWILEFSYLLVTRIVGVTESSGFFGPIFEWLFVILLLTSLLTGGLSDVFNGQLTNIRIIVCVSVILRMMMAILINIGIMAISGCLAVVVLIIILDMNVGGEMTVVLAILAEALGILPLILLLVFLLGGSLGGTILF